MRYHSRFFFVAGRKVKSVKNGKKSWKFRTRPPTRRGDGDARRDRDSRSLSDPCFQAPRTTSRVLQARRCYFRQQHTRNSQHRSTSAISALALLARSCLPNKRGRRGLGSGRGERHLRCMGHTGAGWSDARSSTVKERNPHLACLTRVMSNQSSSEPISPSVHGSHRVCCAVLLGCWCGRAGGISGT